MSEEYIPKNGDPSIRNCLFCSEDFETPALLGEKITCQNCETKFKIHIYSEPTIKAPDDANG